MTSTYSTINNFSIKDIMKRLDRIRTINNIMQDLKEVIVFSREEKRGMKMTLNPTLDLKQFSDAMINEAVENALEDLLKSTRELGIIVEDLSACYTAIPLIKNPENEEDVLIDDRMIDTSNGNSIDANRLQNFTSLPIEETDDNDLIYTNSGMRKDLSDISSAEIIDDLIMRSYDNKMADEIIEEGPYVRVTVGNKSKVIKKSSLCWLLEKTKNRMSTDRLKRFLSKSTEKPDNDKVLAKTQQKTAQRTSKCKRKYKNRKSKEEVVKYTCVQSDSSVSSADDTVVKYNDSTDTETLSASDFENEIKETDEEIEQSFAFQELESEPAEVTSSEEPFLPQFNNFDMDTFLECDKNSSVFQEFNAEEVFKMVLEDQSKNKLQDHELSNSDGDTDNSPSAVVTTENEITFETASKPVKLSYNVYENDGHYSSNLTPLIVLHGLLGSKINWKSACLALNQKTNPKRRVLAIDVRDHGESPHTANITYPNIAGDLKLFLNNLKLKNVSLLGHCLGGRAAMYFTLQYPELVDKLIIVDASPIRTNSYLSMVPTIISSLQKVKFPDIKNTTIIEARRCANRQLKACVKDECLRKFLLTNLYCKKGTGFGWRLNIHGLMTNFEANIVNFPTSNFHIFKRPALFIRGELSDFTSKTDHGIILKYFPKARFYTVKEAGHWIHTEKPKEFIGSNSEIENATEGQTEQANEGDQTTTNKTASVTNEFSQP
ncbi:hypothetical protein RN001_000458 [Aquatica leii]|uniref:sn-1-specific diacylglycerol lipase ABHD11 n=1 Tax=Aquatica leii TaxID=1421715 RepID=A0AAN7PEX1_9COLE|nr:hypothetical protein RN001_000458 [Aquatica leii]